MIKKLLFLLPFTSFIAGYLLIQMIFTTKELYVPTLIGKNLPQACEILSAQNLNIRILAHKEDPHVPPSTILNQTPQANERIKPHQSIYVVVSSHESTHHAPNFVQKSRKEIEDELKNIGIKQTVYYVPSPYPHDTCIAQSPRPGQLIEKNSITLYYAQQNNKPIVWPDFRGKQLSVAKELLETVHIVPQIITSHNAVISDSSLVLDQRPKAGTLLILDENKPICVQLSIQ